MENTSSKVALIILDGWGINPDPAVSAIEAAKKPFFDSLVATYPHTTLTTFGEEVGLPEGQMGNSEVGHMNLGAGRIVYQELVRINKAFTDSTLQDNPVFKEGLAFAKSHNRRIHLMGLVSDGGVHSHISHLLGLCTILKGLPELQVFVHAFLDGRDTDPQSGANFIAQVENNISNSNICLASVIGRYYAMDRDNRWERTKLAFDLLVKGEGEVVTSWQDSVREKYVQKITDEFMPALKSKDFESQHMNIQTGDTVIFFNFRTDRPRQLTHVLTQEDKHEYNMYTLPLHFITFTEYDKSFKNLNIIFEKDNLDNTLGQVLSEAGLTQVRIAETEKYPHVTFFFNGGREVPYPGEARILVPSPKVATYDLQPEMSAVEITEKLIAFVKADYPDFICLNYANTDMVGHTGDFNAAIKATETVDKCLSELIPILKEKKYKVLILADHGNSDYMVNPDGTPNTAHSMNPVPLIVITDQKNLDLCPGKLGDIAPTILHLMGIPLPQIMKGKILIINDC